MNKKICNWDDIVSWRENNLQGKILESFSIKLHGGLWSIISSYKETIWFIMGMTS